MGMGELERAGDESTTEAPTTNVNLADFSEAEKLNKHAEDKPHPDAMEDSGTGHNHMSKEDALITTTKGAEDNTGAGTADLAMNAADDTPGCEIHTLLSI